MAKGIQIYLTEKERMAVIESCTEWCEIMETGEETYELTKEKMDNGLGSALRKLYRGRNGESTYMKYKTVR